MADEALAVVLLAAGCSQRLHPFNKLLLPLWGKPLIGWSMQSLEALPWAQRIAVLGHQADRIAPFLHQWTQRYNQSYRTGHLGSLRTGLHALGAWKGDVLVALADMPLVQQDDILALCHAWRNRPNHILAARLQYRGHAGHPRILGHTLWRTILEDPCFDIRRWFACATSPALVIDGAAGVITDVDTVQDYAIIAHSTGWLHHG